MARDAGGGEPARRPGAAAAVLVLLYTWVMVGFVTGTLVLLGPVRWITAAVRAAGLGREAENWSVKGVIVLLVAGSLLLTRWLLGHVWRARTRLGRLAVPAAATVLAAAALWAWSNPGTMLAAVAGGGAEQSVATHGGAVFLFGPYPDRARLEELRDEGVTTVVSLQHPAVVPFEPQGIADERKNAAELGLRFVHAPMLPWVSSNEASLATLRELARTGEGTFYVHCGLGRDRVNVARRAIERAGARTAGARGLVHASRFEDRDVDFERGGLVRLDSGVWLIPHPNDAEAAGYLLAGQVAHVVSLLDPADPAQARMLAELRPVLAGAAVPLTEHPLPADAGPEAAARAARRARGLPRPVGVVAPRTPYDEPFPGTEAAVAFERAWRDAEDGTDRTESTRGAPGASRPPAPTTRKEGRDG